MKFKNFTGRFFKYNGAIYSAIDKVTAIPYSEEIDNETSIGLKKWEKYQIKYNALRLTNGKPQLEKIPNSAKIIPVEGLYLRLKVPQGLFFPLPYKKIKEGNAFLYDGRWTLVKVGNYIQISSSVTASSYEKIVTSVSVDPYSGSLFFNKPDADITVFPLQVSSFTEEDKTD